MVAQQAAGGTSQRRRQPLGARPQGQPDPEGIIEGGCRGVQGRVSGLPSAAGGSPLFGARRGGDDCGLGVPLSVHRAEMLRAGSAARWGPRRAGRVFYKVLGRLQGAPLGLHAAPPGGHYRYYSNALSSPWCPWKQKIPALVGSLQGLGGDDVSSSEHHIFGLLERRGYPPHSIFLRSLNVFSMCHIHSQRCRCSSQAFCSIKLNWTQSPKGSSSPRPCTGVRITEQSVFGVCCWMCTRDCVCMWVHACEHMCTLICELYAYVHMGVHLSICIIE